MSSVVISGDTSGAITVSAPAVSGTNTLTLQAGTATNSMNTLATAVASTSGTSIDFTSLPSWVKRITVMFSGVSTSGTSLMQIQLGTGSTTYTTTGYNSGAWTANTSNSGLITTGLILNSSSAAAANYYGNIIISGLGSNTWVESHSLGGPSGGYQSIGGGAIALAAVLTAVRITTVNGTDTFDAGSVNILYEG